MISYSINRYKYRKVTEATDEEMRELQKSMIKPNSEITLESEYEKLKEEVNIDDWEQKRGPRPWEETFDTK